MRIAPPISSHQPSRPRCPATGPAAAALALGLLLASGGCFEAESTLCDWGGVCPPGMQCHAPTFECLYPVQLTACRGKPDMTPCGVPGQSAMYLCRGEICHRSVCGDGLVDRRPEVGEVCDDGNTQGGDGCRADCLGLERCGDGLVDEAAGEECDDGNSNEQDGCTTRCLRPYCGDGFVTGGEACDEGEDNSDTAPDACRTSCREPRCGDGVLDTGERWRCWTLAWAGRRDTGTQPVALATGDLDGDGLPDVAVAVDDASAVAVLLSDGLGGLLPAPGSPLLLGDHTADVALGDLDGDGALDLVAVGRGGTVVWFPGRGDGTLGAPLAVMFPGIQFTAVAAADLDGDGAAEILALDETEDALRVFAVTGLAPAAEVSSQPVGSPGFTPVRLALADADGDGRPEVAVACFDFAALALFTTTPGGALAPVAGFPLAVGASWGSTLSDVAFADVDGDGTLDLVYVDARFWEPSELGVLLGDGQLGFTPAAELSATTDVGILRVVGGDVDGDGRQDLVLPSALSRSVTVIFSGAEDLVAPERWVSATLQAQGSAAGLADFDGDGRLDLLLADQRAGYLDLYRNAP